MLTHINTEIDINIEYKETVLKFQMVPVSGSIEIGLATYWETSWSEVSLHIDMTAAEIRDCVVQQFIDTGGPIPPWAYADGQEILDEMQEQIEAHIDVD